MNWFNLITFIVILLISILLLKHEYKKCENIFDKVLFILLLFLFFTPLIVFYLDYYNAFTYIGYTKIVDSNRWFDYIKEYTSTISGCLLSGFILLSITRYQINNEREERAEEKRIENMPVLLFSELSKDEDVDNEYNFYMKGKKIRSYSYYFTIKNIGSNHAKNVKIKFKCDDYEYEYDFRNDGQSFIIKDSRIINRLNISYETIIDTKIVAEYSYHDMLENNYKQVSEFKVETKDNKVFCINIIKVSPPVFIK